jgi:hypothetical protein
MKIKFKEWNCLILARRYDNGRVALQLVDATEGDPIATATINLPEFAVPEGHVLIKDWSENAGMLDALVSAGLVEDTGTKIPTGYVDACLAKLLVPASSLK